MSKFLVFLYTLCIFATLYSCAARKWLPLRLVKGAKSRTNPPLTLSANEKPVQTNFLPVRSCAKSNEDAAVNATDCRKNQSSNDAIIKGRAPDSCRSKETTVPQTFPTKITRSPCHTTAEVCRFTLPPAATTRKFLIGVNQLGKFSVEIHKPPPNGRECCHPGGGRPMVPDEFDEQLPSHYDDPLYQKALSGALAEKIVDEIFKKSAGKGNPVIDPVTSDIHLKALSRTLENSMLEREGCCYKLSGELKCFLALLLLQRPTRRRRSCDCSDLDDNFGPNEFPIAGPSVSFPIGMFGFQAPPLMELP